MSGTAGPAPTGWDKNMTQEDFMFRDECILLDKDDNVVGHANKKVSHVFAPESPRGLLHRAFSVFIFDAQGRLLLQKRAASKITFPNVWTNTCCSHPLYGFAPSEVDGPADVADGSVMGTKRAAIRKLDHELGVPPGTLDVGRFKFLTRLHYWAADVVTHGADSPWGEHEIDYILFCRCAACAALPCNPPPCSGGRSRSRPHEIGSSPCCTCARPGTRHARCFRAGRGSRPRGRPFPLLARLRAGPTGWRCRRTQRRWTRSSG